MEPKVKMQQVLSNVTGYCTMLHLVVYFYALLNVDRRYSTLIHVVTNVFTLNVVWFLEEIQEMRKRF